MITRELFGQPHGRDYSSDQRANLLFDRSGRPPEHLPIAASCSTACKSPESRLRAAEPKKITGKNALIEMLRASAGVCGDDGDCQ